MISFLFVINVFRFVEVTSDRIKHEEQKSYDEYCEDNVDSSVSFVLLKLPSAILILIL